MIVLVPLLTKVVLLLKKKRNGAVVRVNIQDISDKDRQYIIALCKGWRLARDAVREGKVDW